MTWGGGGDLQSTTVPNTSKKSHWTSLRDSMVDEREGRRGGRLCKLLYIF